MRWLLYYPTRRDRVYINAAFKAAENATHRCRHGAVIRRQSHITVGFNKEKNSAKYVYPNNGVHAEIDALRKHKRTGSKICYSVRLNRAGELEFAAPCDSCTKKLIAASVKYTIFTNPMSESGYSIVHYR